MAVARSKTFQDSFLATVSSPGFQPVRTYNLDPDSVLRFEIVVTCRQSDGLNRATFKRLGVFYRIASTTTQIQGVTWQSLETIRSNPTIDISYTLNLTGITINFQNASATPCKWIAKVYMQVVK